MDSLGNVPDGPPNLFAFSGNMLQVYYDYPLSKNKKASQCFAVSLRRSHRMKFLFTPLIRTAGRH